MGLLCRVVHYFLLNDLHQLDALVGHTGAETVWPRKELHGHVKHAKVWLSPDQHHQLDFGGLNESCSLTLYVSPLYKYIFEVCEIGEVFRNSVDDG